jgi:hypothetical protein
MRRIIGTCGSTYLGAPFLRDGHRVVDKVGRPELRSQTSETNNDD